jgi:hypothetical protein
LTDGQLAGLALHARAHFPGRQSRIKARWPASGTAGSIIAKITSKEWTNEQTRDQDARRRQESGNNHEEKRERLQASKSRRLSLATDRCANQGAG